ncbi:crotonobetainyl-CoA:carnitine CoA-transferase CaiB-like acyl-CoA transferase [Ancylobacter aquaticus]|uniref:Crotonobetainyl-CoA:carnitine CoA-transferase CaiB-like acyl-CoA transferase n=1 Tax=Ancylobacter aquaticus TaxID=100 RepID=A0A4R1HME0_ANCAQ|nr:CaiB/BaiF CoA-transferase family protein [Ancylobacter aquaticus]TCK23664.1 crotonobetainyl-CoA:carnitine CoA-transferase CaiB-like acyl-CoA transferase [Ancylobacter aquaticus]
MTDDDMARPDAQALAGIRVLDLSRVLAGPWATQTLGDLGADIIKVEKPGEGDDTRGWGPPWLADGEGRPTRESAYFLAANRNKRSVAIDMATPQGQALIRRLAEQSDVVVENFKVGGLKRYGLDHESLMALNPRLVTCSITGFGQDGPEAGRAGYDFMIQGMSGLMSVTGSPDTEPQKVGVALVDILTGLNATIAILAALEQRHRTGRGQHIDIALFDVAVASLANQALNFLVGGTAPRRLGNAHPNIVPYQAFETSDGHLILAVGNDAQFARFCRLADLPEIAADARFATNRERVAHREALIPPIAAALKRQTTAEWLAMLDAAGIPAGPINTIAQAFAEPQALARGLAMSLPHALGGSAPGVRSPLRLSDSPHGQPTAPPWLGQHTDEVLETRLGLSAAERDALRAAGII